MMTERTVYILRIIAIGLSAGFQAAADAVEHDKVKASKPRPRVRT